MSQGSESKRRKQREDREKNYPHVRRRQIERRTELSARVRTVRAMRRAQIDAWNKGTPRSVDPSAQAMWDRVFRTVKGTTPKSVTDGPIRPARATPIGLLDDGPVVHYPGGRCL